MTFEQWPYFFSIVATPFCLPTHRASGVPVPLLLLCSCFVLLIWFVDSSISDGSEVRFFCEFEFAFLMVCNVDHHFIGLMTICLCLLEKCLFQSFAHLRDMVLYVLISTLHQVWFSKRFTCSTDCPFIFFLVSFHAQCLFSYSLIIFFVCGFDDISMKSWLNSISWNLLPSFFLQPVLCIFLALFIILWILS